MLEVKNLSFSYEAEQWVLRHINFVVKKGEFVSIVGESGCGKSSLIKLIYGLYNWTEGKIIYNGKELQGPKSNLVPGEKYMKYVAQDFNLMPNHTVFENVGKYISNIDLDSKERLIKSCLKTVEMSDFGLKKVKHLSGGQQQRVAIAVALSQQPEILLLDEPFSQIDNFRRSKLRRKIFSYVKKNKISTLLITHDTEDALGFSDRILIMKNGKLIQENTPEIVYNNPKNRYVARLFGELNTINIKDFEESSKKKFTYIHQLKEGNNGVKAVILNSIFRGKDYLNEVEINSKKMYFISENKKEIGDIVFLHLI